MRRDLEIAVRRVRPDEEEPDRLPLRWSTVTRLLAFTAPHAGQRNALLLLCAFRAAALPCLAWAEVRESSGAAWIKASRKISSLSGMSAMAFLTTRSAVSPATVT